MKKILFILLAICLSATACEKKEQSLVNTKWELVGIMDVQTGILTTELEGIGSEIQTMDSCRIKCYSLEFVDEETYRGFSRVNGFGGTYTIDYKTNDFKVIGLIQTLVGGSDDDKLYISSLMAAQSFFLQKKKKELWLYHNDKKNYLLFKRIEP